MKKIINSLAFVVVALFMTTSCNSLLELEPSNGTPSDKAITDMTSATAAINGAYDAFQENSAYYGAKMIYRPDVCGDMMQPSDAGKRCSPDYEMNYTGPSSPNIWDTPYKAINRVNNIIEAFEANKVEDGTEAQRNSIYGQALALRALAHFDLVRNYGNTYTMDNGASLGIPIITKVGDAFNKPSRNTVAQVYDQVIADLKLAISKLAPTKSKGYFNQVAAKALLARVYLYKGENQLAYDTAVDVITNGGYRLWTTAEYPTVWSAEGTAEVLWEIVNFDSNDWVDREAIGYLMSETGYGDIILSKKTVEYFKANPDDVRGQLASNSKVETNIEKFGKDKVWLNKYPGRAGFNDVRVNNTPILRLSEMYLIAAEAAVKLGDQTNADKYLNDIVKRANPAAAGVVATLETVLNEKAIEFVGEGQRLFDLMRNNLESDRTNRYDYVLSNPKSVIFDRTYFRVILAIPQGELNNNENIRDHQNPGYAN